MLGAGLTWARRRPYISPRSPLHLPLDLGAEAPAACSSLGRYSQKLMSSGTGKSAATRSLGPKPPFMSSTTLRPQPSLSCSAVKPASLGRYRGDVGEMQGKV